MRVASVMSHSSSASSGSVRSVRSVRSVSPLPARTAGSRKARARLRMGSLPGRMQAIRHSAPAAPPFSAGNRPASTSEDLPLPELPINETKRCRLSFSRSSSMCSSRPKNRWASSGPNGRRPGNGLKTSICGRPALTMLTSGRAIRGMASARRSRRPLRCAGSRLRGCAGEASRGCPEAPHRWPGPGSAWPGPGPAPA